MDTPKPMKGTWKLVRPDGQTYHADSPLRCASLEMNERVPPSVQVARVLAAADEPTDEEKRLAAEYAKSERRALVFGDIVHNQVLAMQAAVLEGHLNSPAHGLQWIVNTLAGPGHLPDLEEARALGGAQAWFDRETAKHEEFRASHPGPTVGAA